MSGLGSLGQIGVEKKGVGGAPAGGVYDEAAGMSYPAGSAPAGATPGVDSSSKAHPGGGMYGGVGSLIQGGSRNEYGIVGGILSNFGLKYGQPKKTGGERYQEEQAKMLRWKRKMKEKYVGPPSALAGNLAMGGMLSMVPVVGPALGAAAVGGFLAKEGPKWAKKNFPKIG